MKWLEVTRDNYVSQLPNILKTISASQFITFDTELTGLCMNRASRYSALDEAEQRYLKIRDSAINFGLIQVGLTAFQWHSKKSKYHASTNNVSLDTPQAPTRFTCFLPAQPLRMLNGVFLASFLRYRFWPITPSTSIRHFIRVATLYLIKRHPVYK